jgi:hypothetical protein
MVADGDAFGPKETAPLAEPAPPAKPCQKVLSYLPTIAGPCQDKVFFYVLGFGAILLFVISGAGLLGAFANSTITTVNLDHTEEFEFPGMYFCVVNDADFEYPEFLPLVHDGTRQELGSPDGGSKIVAIPISDSNKDKKTGASDMEAPLVKQKGCKAGESFYLDYERNGKMGHTCATAKDTPRAKSIANHMKKLTDVSWDCSVVNDVEQLNATRKEGTMMKLDLVTYPKEGDFMMLVAGFFDTKSDATTMFQENFQSYYVNIYDTMTNIALSMDTLTECTGFAFTPAKEGCNETIKKYSAKINAIKQSLQLKPMVALSRLHFSVDTYLVRKVLIRSKSFSELWAELGGAWASSLLVIGMFFANRTGVPNDESVTVDTHVLRFRSKEERKAFVLGRLKAYTVAKIKSTAIAAAEEEMNS